MYDISIYFFPYIEDLLKNTFIILHIFYNHFVSFWLTRVCRDFLDLHKGSFTEKSSYFMPCCSINHNLSGCVKFRLYWQGRSFLQLCHDRGSYHIESSPLICSESQWTGFYMIGTFFMKELKRNCRIYDCLLPKATQSSNLTTYCSVMYRKPLEVLKTKQTYFNVTF